MEINSKKLDELYEEWSGVHHTTNSNKPVHDSAECTDFAEYCLKWAVSEGEMIPTRESNCNIPLVSNRYFAVGYVASVPSGRITGLLDITTNGKYLNRNLTIGNIEEKHPEATNIVLTMIEEMSKEDFEAWANGC